MCTISSLCSVSFEDRSLAFALLRAQGEERSPSSPSCVENVRGSSLRYPYVATSSFIQSTACCRILQETRPNLFPWNPEPFFYKSSSTYLRYSTSNQLNVPMLTYTDLPRIFSRGGYKSCYFYNTASIREPLSGDSSCKYSLGVRPCSFQRAS